MDNLRRNSWDHVWTMLYLKLCYEIIQRVRLKVIPRARFCITFRRTLYILRETICRSTVGTMRNCVCVLSENYLKSYEDGVCILKDYRAKCVKRFRDLVFLLRTAHSASRKKTEALCNRSEEDFSKFYKIRAEWRSHCLKKSVFQW